MPNEHGGLAWLTFTAVLIGYGVLGIIAVIGTWILLGTIQEIWMAMIGRGRRPYLDRKD